MKKMHKSYKLSNPSIAFLVADLEIKITQKILFCFKFLIGFVQKIFCTNHMFEVKIFFKLNQSRLFWKLRQKNSFFSEVILEVLPRNFLMSRDNERKKKRKEGGEEGRRKEQTKGRPKKNISLSDV